MFFPRLFALTLAGMLAGAVALHAQEGGTPLKVTTTIHGDGTRTDIQKDLDARVSEAKTYDASKRLIQRWVYTLDDQGREVEGISYDAKEKILARVSYSYDVFGNVGEVIEKAANGAPVRRTVYHRDATGQVVGSDTFDAQGNPINPKPGASKKGRSR
ncbi:MAG: hypothetical protein WCH57_07530 [Verrucomicrobiota bacterium]